MKVLLTASEVAPIIKLGGLGDVIGSLPKALERIGVNADVIVPFFPQATHYFSTSNESEKIYKSLDINVPFSGKSVSVAVYKTKLPDSNVDIFLLKNDDYFGKGGKEAFANSVSETELFSFFDKAVVEFIKSEFSTYDLIHCNDWHTGLITHLLQDEFNKDRPKTLFTIHNLLYQGIGDMRLVRKVGIVPGTHPIIDWDTQDGDINLMLEGITSSDFISTVSPSYANEILTHDFAGEFAEILQTRAGRLTGILNGLDYSQFPRNYDVSNWKDRKMEAKADLRKKLGLNSPKHDTPLFAFISRLDPNQKGLTLLLNVIPEIVKKGGQFVLLGTGEKYWEDRLKALENEYKGEVSVNVAFDNALAREIYSSSNYQIVPSKYEPCGLIQMIAMWYGSLPLVSNVGGLRDSVKHGVTGFVFDDYSTEGLLTCINSAFKVYGNKDYEMAVINAMTTDYSWEKSAREYKSLYERIVDL